MPRSPPHITLTSAVVVADRYHLKRQIAAGGMGMVWVAHDDKLARDVAIKILAQQLASHSELLTRFEREAKAVAQLRSIHVVEVYDFGIHDRLPFIVMELLEGESLRMRLRRQGTFTLRETLIITEQIAKGLKSAHAAGLIHRDLKPSNVYLALADDVELVKLLDFGVVKAVDSSGSTDMTASGTLLGTPQYMSPEQVRARRRIDHRSDLWAFGVIVFRMLTGLNPFRGESVGDAALRICSDELPKLSDYSDNLPAELDSFFARAFARNPADRFQTSEELAQAFRAQCAFALSDVSLAAPPAAEGHAAPAECIQVRAPEAHGGVGPSVTPPSTSGVSAIPGAVASDSFTPPSTRQAQMLVAAGGGGASPAAPTG
ncbi:MAG: serine/threonine protein kinase, partial [Deltaproteobacteria bacterium]|nr:serine/threonine protein kinase [Deltaproteobacteria bacterium]MBW2534258.1 serine/threonine protein kinase [Deltaproteobacteria bacterium]